MTFEIIKKNFDRGLWNAKQVEIAKNKGLITEEQYKEIVKSKQMNIGWVVGVNEVWLDCSLRTDG